MKAPALEAAVAASASKTTYGGAATSVAGWLLSNEFAMLSGLLLGFAGFTVNLYFRRRQDRREEREHERRMATPEAAVPAEADGCACRGKLDRSGAA